MTAPLLPYADEVYAAAGDASEEAWARMFAAKWAELGYDATGEFAQLDIAAIERLMTAALLTYTDGPANLMHSVACESLGAAMVRAFRIMTRDGIERDLQEEQATLRERSRIEAFRRDACPVPTWPRVVKGEPA